jgi:hypothetical protein
MPGLFTTAPLIAHGHVLFHGPHAHGDAIAPFHPAAGTAALDRLGRQPLAGL